MRSMLWRKAPPDVCTAMSTAMLMRRARRSQSSPNTGSDGGASTGPKPSMPPRSCTPSTGSVSQASAAGPYAAPRRAAARRPICRLCEGAFPARGGVEPSKCGKIGISQRIRTRRHPLTVGNASDPLPLLIDPVFLLLALAEGVHRGPCVQLSDVQHHALALQLELRVRLAFAA